MNGVLGTCTIETSYDPATGKPDNRVGGDVHAVKVAIYAKYDGRVYHADGSPVGSLVGGDGETWSNISIKRGAPGRPEPDETAHDLLHRYAKHVVGAVAAAGHSEVVSHALPDPFHIPNTFEARAGIAPVQDHIRGDRIAIIGLGGTGAFLLDLIAKTPLSGIHLFDSDCVDWDTLMRAPGVPTAENSNRFARVRYSRSITIVPSTPPFGTAFTRILFEWKVRNVRRVSWLNTPSTLHLFALTSSPRATRHVRMLFIEPSPRLAFRS